MDYAEQQHYHGFVIRTHKDQRGYGKVYYKKCSRPIQIQDLKSFPGAVTYIRTCTQPTLPYVDYFDSSNSINFKGFEYNFDYVLDDEAYKSTVITNANFFHSRGDWYQTYEKKRIYVGSDLNAPDTYATISYSDDFGVEIEYRHRPPQLTLEDFIEKSEFHFWIPMDMNRNPEDVFEIKLDG